MFLLAATAAVQSVDRRLESLVIPPPPLDPNTGATGADDWEVLSADAGVDALALVLEGDGDEALPGRGDLAPFAAATRAEGKSLWLWPSTDRVTEEGGRRVMGMAAELRAEAVLWPEPLRLRG
jgi:hypothetical protein